MPLVTRHFTGKKDVCAAALLLSVMAGGMMPSAARADAATITINSPQPEETIHDNNGAIAVAVVVRNGGAARDALRFRVLLDEQPYGPIQHSLSFTLAGVERGEHTLRVQSVDAAGNAIASSGTVKFYMWQASQLFPGRK